MDIQKLTDDLFPLIKASAVLSPNTIEVLRTCGPEKIAAMKARLDGVDVGESINHYKVAYILGQHIFQKKAENLLIQDAINKLADFTDNSPLTEDGDVCEECGLPYEQCQCEDVDKALNNRG